MARRDRASQPNHLADVNSAKPVDGVGLAAGAAITGILSRPGRAVQMAALSRGLAQLITSPAFRKWVTKTKRVKLDSASQAQAAPVSPMITDVVTGTLAENEDVKAALD